MCGSLKNGFDNSDERFLLFCIVVQSNYVAVLLRFAIAKRKAFSWMMNSDRRVWRRDFSKFTTSVLQRNFGTCHVRAYFCDGKVTSDRFVSWDYFGEKWKSS